MKLSDWLVKNLEERDWSQRELARRAKISAVQVSDVISGKANPGATFCLAIARALNERPETIFRLAGILPPSPEDRRAANPVLDEAMILFEQLTEVQCQSALQMLRGLAESRVSYSAAVVQGQAEPEMAEAVTHDVGRRQSFSVSVAPPKLPGASRPVDTALASIGPEAAAEGKLALLTEQTFYPQGDTRAVLLWLLDQVAKLAEPEDMEQVTRLMEQWQRERGGTGKGIDAERTEPREGVSQLGGEMDASLPEPAPGSRADKQ